MTASLPYRLPQGGRIDRASPRSFTLDGRMIGGFKGDTLASAVLASGLRLVGRSFKYHRPRGIFTAGPEEPNALVELRKGAQREPNTRATTAFSFLKDPEKFPADSACGSDNGQTDGCVFHECIQ